MFAASLVLVFFCTLAPRTGQSCAFASKTYNIGEVWYPRVGQPGAQNCIACICLEGGKMNCTIHQCTKDCFSPSVMSDECCKHCARGSSVKPRIFPVASAFSSPSVEALRPAPPSFTPSLSNESDDTTCLHNGQLYKNKEKFTSTAIGIQPDRSNQCVQCVCETGMVLCKLRDCPRAECSNPVKIQDDCCPVCPDEAGRIDEMENSPVIISQPTSSKMEDCISGGRYYLHGSTWHPVMGPFGPMDCVICQCRSGRIECQRLECPLQMPCDKPIKVTGRCCPVCPIDKVVKGSSTVSTGISSRSKSHQNQESDMSVCLPPNTDIIAHRAQGSGNSSEYIQYIFQGVQPLGRNGKTSLFIEHHLWMVQTSGISKGATYKVQDLTKEHLQALKQRFRFVTLGASNIKDLKKFSKRERRLRPKCKDGCVKKVRRLERSLSLKEVFKRKSCLTGETEVV